MTSTSEQSENRLLVFISSKLGEEMIDAGALPNRLLRVFPIAVCGHLKTCQQALNPLKTITSHTWVKLTG